MTLRVQIHRVTAQAMIAALGAPGARCSIPGCEIVSPLIGGMCRAHYRRVYRTGDAMPDKPLRRCKGRDDMLTDEEPEKLPPIKSASKYGRIDLRPETRAWVEDYMKRRGTLAR